MLGGAGREDEELLFVAEVFGMAVGATGMICGAFGGGKMIVNKPGPVLVGTVVVEEGLASLKGSGFSLFAMVIWWFLIFLLISDLPNKMCQTSWAFAGRGGR